MPVSMDAAALFVTTQQILAAAFLLSTLFGFIAQRSHFCTMGAISDIFNLGDWTRMRMWMFSAAVAMLGFSGFVYLGWIAPEKTLYGNHQIYWLSAVVGGFMFGFGMVLASGCANKTLLRISSGNLKSLVVFVVMGIAAYATLKGITAVVRVNTVDMFRFHAPALDTSTRWYLSLGIAAILMGWGLRHADMRRLSHLMPSLLIGILVAGVWFVSGVWGYVPEHPDTLQEAFLATNSGRMESLSFVAPIAYVLDWLMFFSDKSKVLTLGMVSVFGVILGGFLESKWSKTFCWEGFGSVEDLANHLIGAVLMGVGGVTAIGCTIGHGLSGISTLSITSLIALFAIVAGAITAFKYQIWRIERM